MSALFNISYDAAVACFEDLSMFEIIKVGYNSCKFVSMTNCSQNPMGTQPTVWNDPDGTPALRTQLLWDIRRQQSPGDIHIMDALRTPAGRQVLNFFILYASLHEQLDTK